MIEVGVVYHDHRYYRPWCFTSANGRMLDYHRFAEREDAESARRDMLRLPETRMINAQRIKDLLA